jgi:wyosine [tRNA(Phe)-imidazoG37] synthetase (radical SAM superfamily)
MDYKFIKTLEFNFNYGTILAVDFSSLYEGTNLININEEIISEIKDCVKNQGIPDLIWFKGIGDSIKYSNSKEIIEMIKQVYPYQKIGVYLSCAIFEDEIIREDFYGCDLVAINLNSVDPLDFTKINKCPESTKPTEVLEGIKEFSNNFKGKLGIYTMFLSGINDNIKNIEDLRKFLLEVMPDYYSVSYCFYYFWDLSCFY